jgi:type IV pilus assembly protein PilF
MVLLLFMQACHNQTQHISSTKHGNAALYNTQLGLAYFAQGNRERAKHKLLTALAQDPKSPGVNAAMAFYLEKTGEIDRAGAYYQKALLLSSEDGAQLNNYGAYLCRRGQYRQAELYFLKAANDMQYEHTSVAYENAGLCAEAIPDYKKATQYFEKALRHDPSRKQSLYELLSIDLKLKQFSRARKRLKNHPDLFLNDPKLRILAVQIKNRHHDART